jgi:hypothetical protein
VREEIKDKIEDIAIARQKRELLYLSRKNVIDADRLYWRTMKQLSRMRLRQKVDRGGTATGSAG